MQAAQKTAKPVDKWIPWFFVIFFVGLAVLDGIFVTLAVKTHTGVVTDRAYEEGLAYNETLASAAAQRDLGWAMTITAAGGALSATLADKNGGALDGAAVVAKISRPVQDGHDFELTLAGKGGGVYSAPVSFPLPGQWNVRIYATWQGQPYQQSWTITAP